jgi:hypothetical protein
MSSGQVAAFLDSLRSLLMEMEELRVPTIAVVDGFAMGGGCELALGCDLRVGGGWLAFASASLDLHSALRLHSAFPSLGPKRPERKEGGWSSREERASERPSGRAERWGRTVLCGVTPHCAAHVADSGLHCVACVALRGS